MKSIHLLLLAITTTTIANSQNTRTVSRCVIEDGVLKSINVEYNTETGSLTYVRNGKTIDFEKMENQKDYAQKKPWYVNSEKISFGKDKYTKYGLPRILGIGEVTRAGLYDGVGIYVEANSDETPPVLIYVPVRQGCEFQPYLRETPECGDLTITPSVKSIKLDTEVTFTANVKSKEEDLLIYWDISTGGDFVGSDEGNKVTIYAYKEEELLLEVVVEGNDCKSTKSIVLAVKK